MTQANTIPSNVRFIMRMERLFRMWIPVLLSLFFVFNLLPIIAPVMMQTGATPIGNGIYDLYGIISHQYANRSFFLFGEKLTYQPEDFPFELEDDFVPDTAVLKAFRGNENLGYKLAWSDRLVAMYGSMLIVFVVFAVRRWQNFPLWLGILLVLPLVLDGATHLISDSTSVISGWRYDNAWFASLTGNVFGDSFYIGDNFGTFNSWLRLLTGILFGVGFFSWGLPVVDRYFARNADTLKAKLDDWRARQT